MAGATFIFLILEQITALQESLHQICLHSLNDHMNAQSSDDLGAEVDQAQ